MSNVKNSLLAGVEQQDSQGDDCQLSLLVLQTSVCFPALSPYKDGDLIRTTMRQARRLAVGWVYSAVQEQVLMKKRDYFFSLLVLRFSR